MPITADELSGRTRGLTVIGEAASKIVPTKLGVSDRTAAVTTAMARGLLQ